VFVFLQCTNLLVSVHGIVEDWTITFSVGQRKVIRIFKRLLLY